MNRRVYGIIIALLLFNSLSTTAILVIFVAFTNQLIAKLEMFPPMIDTRINSIVGTLDATVDDKLDSVVGQFNRTLYTFMDETIASFSKDFNGTIGSMYLQLVHRSYGTIEVFAERGDRFVHERVKCPVELPDHRI